MPPSYTSRRAAILALASETVMCFLCSAFATGGADRDEEAELNPRSPAREELLRLIDELEVKLPRELARKLIVISMKLSTGYCSPYAAREFEEAVESLSVREIRAFEAEWKKVRDHEHWPRMPKPQPDKPRPERSPRSG